MWGVRGRALSHPRLPALWAGCRGPLPTGCGCGGVRAWGPVTNPTARALASLLCALWGRHEGARGGASCLGVGRLGWSALPLPTARPLGGLLGPTTHWLWVRGGAGVETRHKPHSARSFELALRAVGAARGRPGGAPPAWVWVVRCRALCHPRLPALLGGLPGPTTHWLWVGEGAGVGTGHKPHSARSCELALPAVGAARGRPGGAPPAWVWVVRCRALCHPRLPALLGGLPGPTTHWLWVLGAAGVGTHHQPNSARSFELALRAVGAARGCPGGGRLLPGCRASGVGRSPTPDCRPSRRAAGAHYPLAVGAGGCGRGDPSPTPQRALLRAGFARCGGGMRVPGGAPLAWVWGFRGRALSHSRLPALWAGCRGPLPTGCGCGGVRAWRPLTNPTARALSSWLCALWGRHQGALGGPLLPGSGSSGVGRSATPDCPPSWAGCRGPLPTGCGWGGVRAWGPVTNPTARALSSWLCALWGRHEDARGGASCLGVGRPGSGALPPPTARPLGGLPGPTTHWLWVWGGAGVGTRHQPNSARSFELALRAVGAARGCPGGGASCLGVGRPGSGVLPLPTAGPLGGLPGPTTH